MYVPCNTEEMLRASYGPNWFIPVHDSKWVWDKSSDNTMELGKADKDEDIGAFY